tara:strand:- start:54 stop:1142 length:1089 start_codon:yes stop_codon:yes gene_type:complete
MIDNPNKKELDLIDTLKILTKNFWIIFTITISCLVAGYFYIYLFSNIKTQGYASSVNILIEDNPVYSKKEIVDKLNTTIISSYNYEKWSENNTELAKNLNQSYIATFDIDAKFHNINMSFSSKDIVESFMSYLTFTTKVVSDKIVNILKQDLKNKIVNAEKIYETEIRSLENQILELQIEIEVAEEQQVTIENKLNDQQKESADVIIFKLELERTINENKIKLEQLKKKKEKNIYSPEQAKINRSLKDFNEELLNFINTHIPEDKLNINTDYALKNIYDSKKLIDNLEFFTGLDELSDLEKKLKDLDNKEVIKIGKTITNYYDNPTYTIRNNVIYSAALIIGLILSISFVFIKEEFTRRSNN